MTTAYFGGHQVFHLADDELPDLERATALGLSSQINNARRVRDLQRPRRLSELPIGFTPVRNKRIDAAIAAAALALLDAGEKPEKVHRLAVKHVARTLPSLPFAKRHHVPRPSKSDDPDYRRGNRP